MLYNFEIRWNDFFKGKKNISKEPLRFIAHKTLSYLMLKDKQKLIDGFLCCTNSRKRESDLMFWKYLI